MIHADNEDLILDILTVCNRHNIASSQVISVFTDMALMKEVVKTLEISEGDGVPTKDSQAWHKK